MKPKVKQQLLSVILIFSMFLSLLPATARAEGADPDTALCPHHAEHTEDHDHADAIDGAPCTHFCEICAAQTNGEPTPGIVEQPWGGIQPDGDDELARWLSEQPWDYSRRFNDEELIWLKEELDLITDRYNAGILPAAFLEEDYIPWDTFEPVTNTGRESDNKEFREQWNAVVTDETALAAAGLSMNGYHVNLGGISVTKFPAFDRKDFTGVSVDGVPAHILGVLTTKTHEKVFYYLAEHYVESTDSTRVSAVILDEKNDQKFTVTYTFQEYAVEYHVRMEDGTRTGWPTDSNGVALNEATVLNMLLGDTMNTTSIGLACSFDVSLTQLYDYQVRVMCYRKLGADEFGDPIWDAGTDLTGPRTEDKASHEVNRGNPIGMEPEYRSSGKYDMIETRDDRSAAPITRLFSATFYEDNMTSDLKIELRLTQLYNGDDKVPVFDARPFLNSAEAGGNNDRGASGNPSDGAKENPQHAGNIIPESSSWNWGTFKTQTKAMKQEPDGSYSYTWTFQTNSSDIYFLDKLEINGINMNIPTKSLGAMSQEAVNEPEKYGLTPEPGHTSTVLVLPDGTNVEMIYVHLLLLAGRRDDTHRLQRDAHRF